MGLHYSQRDFQLPVRHGTANGVPTAHTKAVRGRVLPRADTQLVVSGIEWTQNPNWFFVFMVCYVF